MNNLYIIEEVLSDDNTPGMAVIAAPSLDRCREIFVEKFGESMVDEYDYAVGVDDYKVFEIVNHAEGVVSYVYGGA